MLAAFEDDEACPQIAHEMDKSMALLASDGAEVVLIASGLLWALIRARRLDQSAVLPVLANVPILVQELAAAAQLSRLGVPAVSRVGRFAAAPASVRESLRIPSA